MALLFHAFSIPKYWYVFDANTNSIFSVDEEQYKALSEIENGEETPHNIEVLKYFQYKGFCLDVKIEKIEHPVNEVLQVHLEKRIEQCTLQVTQKCNLRCEYCAYSGKYNNRGHASASISFETAKRAIDFTLERSEDTPTLAFAFYGGEPLLELLLIEKCIKYINEQAPNRKIIFTTTTNGTLLTPSVYEILSRYGVNIVISLDGPKQIHDMARKFPNGSGSYDVIIKNIKNIQEKYPEASKKISFMAIMNPGLDDAGCIQELFNSNDVLDFYNYSSNFISDIYTKEKIAYNDAFLLTYNHELCKMFLYMLGKLDERYTSPILKGQKGRIITEYKQLKKIIKLPATTHPGGPCIAGAKRLFVDVNGQFYPCERVSEESTIMNIGNLDTGFDLDKVRMLMNPGYTTAEQCKKCWAIMHCTMCAAYSDNLTGISKDLRLSRCNEVRAQYDSTLKTICFLKENGYNFNS